MNSTFSKQIAKNPELVHAVFGALPEPTFLIDKRGTYIEAWGGTDTKRHHDPSALIGLNQYQVLPADKAIWFSQVIVDVIDNQDPAELEYSIDPKDLTCFSGMDGPTELQYFSALVIPLPDTDFVLWTVRNITEYKQAFDTLAHQQQELEKLTHIDHLTQVYNRYALDSLLPEAIELASYKQVGTAILMIDIDCFKQYNDSYGHLKGDETLKTVGATIQSWSQSNDLCFRYGGDEFLVFIANVSERECLHRAAQLQDLITSANIPHQSSSVKPFITVTIGIQHYPFIPDQLNSDTFISIADKALFFAKNHQRGSIHLYDKQ